MNTTDLVRFEKDGIEVYVNTSTGESFATVSGYARMSDKAKSTIQSRVDRMSESERFNLTKSTELLINNTIQSVRLLNEQLICEWLPKDNPEMATKLMKLGVRVFLHTIAGYEVKSTVIVSDQTNLAKQATELIDLIFSNVPIKPELIAGIKLNATQQLCPELKDVLEPSRQLLINNTAQPYQLLTVTQIGQRLGISGQKVNQLLIEKGLQVKNANKKSKKESNYLPTEKGKQYSELVLSTGKDGDSSSYQQLRWYNSIIELLVV